MKQVPPHFLLAPAVLAGVLAWHIPARANDGTIVITGNIVDNTCEVVDPPQPNHIKVVHLPKISTSALKKTGDTAGATPFSIKLQNCPESLGNGVKLYFEPGPTTDYSTRDLTAYKLAYTANSTTNSNIVAGQVAEGVQIRIANLDGTQIPMGENAAGQNARPAPWCGPAPRCVAPWAGWRQKNASARTGGTGARSAARLFPRAG